MAAEPSNARSRRTRDALLAATRQMVERDGLAAVTMGAVAERAGVTRRSVYLHFTSRSELVEALFDYVAETEGLARSLAKVWAAPTALDALTRWAEHLARYHARVLPVDRAMTQVYRDDPDAAAHRKRVAAAKLENCRRLAQRLADEDELADGWTAHDAADMLYALTTSDVVEGLLVDRGWTRGRFVDRLGGMLRAGLTRSAAVAARS
jgi:AcrR family transcriptional regulator